MKILKAEVIVPDYNVELELEDDADLSKEDIEDMLFNELEDDLGSLNIKFLYEIEEVEND